MKLVIDRNKWLRGEGCAVSALFRSYDQKMCCVGFYCLQLGLTEKQIQDVTAAIGVKTSKALPPWLLEQSSDIEDISRLYFINDDPTLSDNSREQQIAFYFAKHDIKVEFIN